VETPKKTRLRLGAHVWAAVSKTYGFKPPRANTKNGDFSLVIWALAGVFFVCRLIWPVQIVKCIGRCASTDPRAETPALATEIYLLFLIAFWSVALGAGLHSLDAGPRFALLLLAIVCAFEAVSSNIYYLLLRAMVDDGTPHNIHRSFVMASLALAQFWLSTTAIWVLWHETLNAPVLLVGKDPYAVATTLQTLYFTATTMFTIGYGDITPDPAHDGTMWLAMATMAGSFAMISIIIARAVSLLPVQRQG
jgi:hypothetical protein